MKKQYLISSIIVCIILLLGCDATIHQYPEPQTSLVILQLNVDRNPPRKYKELVFDDKWNVTTNILEDNYAETFDPSPNIVLLITVDIFRGDIADIKGHEDIEAKRIQRFVLYKDRISLPPQDSISLYLPDGDYSVMAWADYVYEDTRADGHYTSAYMPNI